MDVDIPNIGSYNTAHSLGDHKAWPHFNRICVPDTFPVQYLIYWIERNGWTEISLIYDQELFNVEIA
jgi:hypothetical protein